MRMSTTSRPILALFLVAMMTTGSACGDSEDGLGERTAVEDESEEIGPPTNINQLTKAGPLFVARNPRWLSARSGPELIGTTDMTTWETLPGLPERVSAVGLGAIGDQLLVAATTCHGDSDEDLCGTTDPDVLSGATAGLMVWLLDEVKLTYRQVDVPENTTISLESLGATTQGESAALIQTTSGPLLVTAEGTSQNLNDAQLELNSPLGWTLAGSKIIVVGFSGDPASVRARAQLQYLPPGADPELEQLAAGDFAIQSISWVDTAEPLAPPTKLSVPGDVPDVYPFLTPTEAIWLDGSHDYSIDLASGAFDVQPLPSDVALLASVVNPAGGRDGRAAVDGKLYLTPDPVFATDPSSVGIAQRAADGSWTVASKTPIPSTPLVIADEGLFAVLDGSQIKQYAK
jgi:hypothetical protein